MTRASWRVQAVLSGAVAMTFLLNIDDTIFKSMQARQALYERLTGQLFCSLFCTNPP